MSTTEASWWQRNWKWAVPLGCLTSGCLGLLLIVGLLIAGGASIFSGLFSLFKSSPPYRTYQMAAERVKNDPNAIAQLGQPISTGFAGNTRYKENGNVGKVCMFFPLSGSRRGGSVYVETVKSNDAWNFRQLVVKVDGGTQPIVLVPLPQDDNQPLCPDSEFKNSKPSNGTPSATP